MTTQVRFLFVAGLLVMGGAALALRPSGTPSEPASTSGPAGEAGPTAAPAGTAATPPLPPALAEAAKENCDTAAAPPPEAAPIAKFMEAAPCGPGEAPKAPSGSPASAH